MRLAIRNGTTGDWFVYSFDPDNVMQMARMTAAWNRHLHDPELPGFTFGIWAQLWMRFARCVGLTEAAEVGRLAGEHCPEYGK